MFFCKLKETATGTRTLCDLKDGEKAVIRCLVKSQGCHLSKLAAMGITEEHSLHHLTRRLWSWREEGGTERFWSARLGALVQGTQGPLWTFITDRDEEPAA